ncbi:MAG: methyltransferase domain-containing protein [Patescibacteria group bacterium]
MKYLAILGQNPYLSLAEIAGVYPETRLALISKEAAILDSQNEISIDELGGIPKLGLVLEDDIAVEKAKQIIADELKKLGSEQKIFFGISFYNNQSRNLYNKLGKEIKKNLADAGYKVRWAVSRDLALSSVYIKTNKLLTRGFDFNIIFFGGKVCVAKTIAVQDFSGYEFRDMRRPARDLYAGMTPPKLAKLLINLKRGKMENILDPFCGSGTLLSEAAVLGFKEVYGSDASDKAVADTKENLEWIKKNYKKIPEVEIKKCRAEDLAASWNRKFDYIATEPYLGPAVRGGLTAEKAKELQKDLNANYEKYLAGISSILNKDGYLILIVPFFITQDKNFYLSLKLKENGFSAVPPLPKNIYSELSIKYSRPDQKVGREIYILKKMS